jgi:hypothetical protein
LAWLKDLFQSVSFESEQSNVILEDDDFLRVFILDCVLSNGRMIGKYKIGKDLEGRIYA